MESRSASIGGPIVVCRFCHAPPSVSSTNWMPPSRSTCVPSWSFIACDMPSMMGPTNCENSGGISRAIAPITSGSACTMLSAICPSRGMMLLAAVATESTSWSVSSFRSAVSSPSPTSQFSHAPFAMPMLP